MFQKNGTRILNKKCWAGKGLYIMECEFFFGEVSGKSSSLVKRSEKI